MKKIWLSIPHMGKNEIKYIEEAFRTNWIAPRGPHVNKFENKLRNYISKNKHVIALSSGTVALHLSLILAGVEKNDIVMCQSLTFAASAFSIKYIGATPIFIDSETSTWNIDPEILEEAILDLKKKGKKIKVLIAVHIYGMPFQVDKIKSICKKYNIILIEDAAEALGSLYKGKKCSSFGDFSAISFNGNKIITTSGGGALICNSQNIKDKTIFLSNQARENTPHYEHLEIGYNYRMSNICASIGLGQLDVLQDRIAKRRKINTFYTKLFEQYELKMHSEPNENFFSNHWLSVIILPNYKTREALRLFLEKNIIESRPIFKPMHLQPVFANCQFYNTHNVSESLFEKGLCLPSGSNLTNNELQRIENVIKEFFKYKI